MLRFITGDVAGVFAGAGAVKIAGKVGKLTRAGEAAEAATGAASATELVEGATGAARLPAEAGYVPTRRAARLSRNC